jgi:hypothetical protein
MITQIECQIDPLDSIKKSLIKQISVNLINEVKSEMKKPQIDLGAKPLPWFEAG